LHAVGLFDYTRTRSGANDAPSKLLSTGKPCMLEHSHLAQSVSRIDQAPVARPEA